MVGRSWCQGLNKHMENEEINGLLWDCLAGSHQPLSVLDLVRKTGVPTADAQRCLVRLRQANLVEAREASPITYVAVLRLDALRWAQAASLGIGLVSLERYAALSSSVKAEALKMATDGSLVRADARVKAGKIKTRNDILHGRAASRAAATDLAKILKDTQNALESAEAKQSPKERAVALLLQQANQEAKRALDGLVKVLEGK